MSDAAAPSGLPASRASRSAQERAEALTLAELEQWLGREPQGDRVHAAMAASAVAVLLSVTAFAGHELAVAVMERPEVIRAACTQAMGVLDAGDVRSHSKSDARPAARCGPR